MTRFGIAATAALALVLAGATARADDDEGCVYRGSLYSDGAMSCQGGTQYRCDDGEWDKTDDSCTAEPVAQAKTCSFGGIQYATGASSCQAGAQYRCTDGAWQSTGETCPIGDTPLQAAPQGKTCTYEGATVAHRSAICKGGTTFFCNDGQWTNLGTACQ